MPSMWLYRKFTAIFVAAAIYVASIRLICQLMASQMLCGYHPLLRKRPCSLLLGDLSVNNFPFLQNYFMPSNMGYHKLGCDICIPHKEGLLNPIKAAEQVQQSNETSFSLI